MITKVLLIRHGQTQSNLNNRYMGYSDEDLNIKGYEQIKRLSIFLKHFPINIFYSSPLKRARVTAEYLAKPHNLCIEINQGLNEINFGEWSGLRKAEIEIQWPEIWKQVLIDPAHVILPRGESFQATTERALKAINEIIEIHQGQCIAIITHDIIIKIIVIAALQAPTAVYHNFQIDCSSLTILEVKNKHFRLIELNSLSHLLFGDYDEKHE